MGQYLAGESGITMESEMANRFITLVIQLPQSEEAAKSVTEGLSIGGNFRGGQKGTLSRGNPSPGPHNS